jgi:hypothetical protein
VLKNPVILERHHQRRTLDAYRRRTFECLVKMQLGSRMIVAPRSTSAHLPGRQVTAILDPHKSETMIPLCMHRQGESGQEQYKYRLGHSKISVKNQRQKSSSQSRVKKNVQNSRSKSRPKISVKKQVKNSRSKTQGQFLRLES